jgi:hypothetical protein
MYIFKKFPGGKTPDPGGASNAGRDGEGGEGERERAGNPQNLYAAYAHAYDTQSSIDQLSTRNQRELHADLLA